MDETLKKVLEQAQKEVEEEIFREKVELEKERLRQKNSFFFPWAIKIVRRFK